MKKIIEQYKHRVQYYETDQMGIVHHSNYIRWFEEARVDFLMQIGFSYDRMEREGVISPVLGVSAEYKAAVHFPDEVFIVPRIESFNGVKFTISYEVRDAATGELKTVGESRHCFLGADFKPIRLQKENTELYKAFKEAAESE